MALQGDLKDFSITEIIQLIGQQFKTGVLNVQHRRKKIEIYFVDGMIVHVFSNYRARKDLLGEILVKAQVITQQQLDQALKVQQETLQYLGEILIDLQLLKREEVLRVIQNQIYETIYDLFQWGEGSFRFDLRLVEKYRRLPLALSPESGGIRRGGESGGDSRGEDVRGGRSGPWFGGWETNRSRDRGSKSPGEISCL
jgi:hypothetical protein